MKVLWFSNSPGNASECLMDGFVGSSWIPALDKGIQRKIDLHLAFYYPKKSDSFKYGETTYHPIGSKYWRFNVLIDIFRNRIIDKQDLGRYLDIINCVKPDIIHIHGTENPFGCIIPYTNIPVIVSIQGYLTVIDRKYKNNFTDRNLKASSSDFSGGIKNFILRKSFLRKKTILERNQKIERRNLLETKHIIGRTDWDRRVGLLLAPKSKYYHCDEIMRENFYKTNWKYNQKSKLVIHSTIGNNPYKGFETICEALYELKRIDIQVEWQIVGINQEDSIVKVTRNMLKSKFPLVGIKYLGKVVGQELVTKMIDADIFVSASHIENSSNSLCEAMLLGMPCIATYVGGTGALISDQVEGILIQDGDPWALAGAIIELYKNPDIACTYGKKARERALERHNSDRIVKDLINIYSEVLSEYYIGI